MVKVIPEELWRKIFSRGVICSVCGEVIEEGVPMAKLHDAVVHEGCVSRDLGEALF